MSKSKRGLGTHWSGRDYKRMKWKNGGGFSDEIAIHPPEAEFPRDSFLWRLSSAEIAAEGAFSQFEGYQRYLTVLSDNSLRLVLGSSPQTVEVRKGHVVTFSGEEQAGALLLNGPVKDLNLICKKGKVRSEFLVLEILDKPRSFRSLGKTVLIVNISGKLRASLYPKEEKYNLGEMDTLKVQLDNKTPDEEVLFLFEAETPHCWVVWIELDY